MKTLVEQQVDAMGSGRLPVLMFGDDNFQTSPDAHAAPNWDFRFLRPCVFWRQGSWTNFTEVAPEYFGQPARSRAEEMAALGKQGISHDS